MFRKLLSFHEKSKGHIDYKDTKLLFSLSFLSIFLSSCRYVPKVVTFTAILQLDGKPEETGLNIECTDGSSAEFPVGSFAPDMQILVKELLVKQGVGTFNIDEQKITIVSS